MSAKNGSTNHLPREFPSAPWSLWSPPVVGVAAKAHEGFVALVREWLDFVGRRFNDDVGLARRLTECRTHEEVVSAYTEFLRKATDDYSKQITAMTKLTTAAMGNVIDAGKLATDEAFTVSKAA